MSEWELVTEGNESSGIPSTSEWELVSSPVEKPSFGRALLQAPGKVAEDIYGGINNIARNIPGYLKQFPQKSTEALVASRFHPLGSLSQTAAGGFEGARNFMNIPSDLSNYLSERLNLVPENINQFMQNTARIPDVTDTINNIFGKPEYPGQETLRSGGRNIFNLGMGLNGITGLNNLRPSQFIKNKSSTIQNEYQAAKALEKQTFSKVFDKYGNNNITVDPSAYFQKMGIERKKLMHDARIAYDNALKEPSLNNIHKLQSRISADANKVFENYPNKYQTFREYKNRLMDDTQKYLGKIDEGALKDYNLGRQITRDVVSPYTSGNLLEQVARGVYPEVSARELSSAIKKGKRDIIYENEGRPVTAIHGEHPLVNHLNDIERSMRNYRHFKYGVGGALATSGLIGAGNRLGEMYFPE